MMTVQELTRLVALGEGVHLEFKRKVPRAERIAKEVIAFANTRGGRLLLGVDDDGTIVGVKDAEEEEFELRRALNQHCDPPITFSIERIDTGTLREVLLVTVPESDHKPHYLIEEKQNGHQTAYVRLDDMSIEASKEAVQIMKEEGKSDHVFFEFGEKELTLLRYLESYGRITVEQLATLTRITPDEASRTLIVLTQAGILHAHSDPRADFFTLV